MGAKETGRFLEQWRMDARDLHRRMILAPTPWERWHAMGLLSQGWTATAEALNEIPIPSVPYHRSVGRRLRGWWFPGLDFRAVRGFPSALGEEQQAELRPVVIAPPAVAGIGLANWNWRAVHSSSRSVSASARAAAVA